MNLLMNLCSPQIISNEESGNDVDKWDYFARNNYIYRNMGFEWNYHNCFIDRSRVLKVDGSWHISYLDKVGVLHNNFISIRIPTTDDDHCN